MNEIAQILGWGVMVLGGGAAVVAGLVAVYWTAHGVGQQAYKRLRRIYHWHVVAYWLDRLEKGGVRVFQKAEEEDAAYKARQAAALATPAPAQPEPKGTTLDEKSPAEGSQEDEPVALVDTRNNDLRAHWTDRSEAAKLEHGTPLYLRPSRAAAPAEGAAGRDLLEAAAKAIEALRDDHCAGTKRSTDKQDWCEPDDVACEFVVAWNEAAAAVRALAAPTSPTPAQEGKP